MKPLMQGPALLRSRVVAYLANAVPPLIDQARIEWGLTDLQLPYPVRYDAADPYNVAEYPVMGMYVVSDRDHVHRDITDVGEREYYSLYTCRLFVAGITPKQYDGEFVQELPFEETIRVRDNLRTVLVNALLQSPSMAGLDVEFREETIQSEYDEPMRPNEKRHVFMAAAVINVDINMTEYVLPLPPIGTVQTTKVEVIHVPIEEHMP